MSFKLMVPEHRLPKVLSQAHVVMSEAAKCDCVLAALASTAELNINKALKYQPQTTDTQRELFFKN